MGNTSGKASWVINPKELRVVVIGDSETGKSSLIVSAITQTHSSNAPHVLPPTTFHSRSFPDDPVPLIVIDTSSSSSVKNEKKRNQLLRQAADGVVLTYSCYRLETLHHLATIWLPTLRQLKLNVPVVVVGCKSDLGAETKEIRENILLEITQQFPEIETFTECSAANASKVFEVIKCIQSSVLYPRGPIYHPQTQKLKPQCDKALKWIFKLCDLDRDGALSAQELNHFLAKCLPSQIEDFNKDVKEKLPQGFNDSGLTLMGFLSLHEHFDIRTTWAVLRRFGYDTDFKLRDDILPISFERSPDQTVELTQEAIEFLKNVFCQFDHDDDGALEPAELDDLFSCIPESPWGEGHYVDATATTLGGLLLDGFLSKWALMTLLEPAKSLATLSYIGYEGDPTSAFHITRQRQLDRKKQQSKRTVFQCFVFGPNLAGKSALLNSFLRRPFSPSQTSNNEEQLAANVVNRIGDTNKTLVLRKIPIAGVKDLLSTKDSLAACDVAVFVHDSSSILSCTRATELLVAVASHAKDYGFEVPCLILAAKSDRNPNPLVIEHSTRVSRDMALEAPISVSVKLEELNDVFCKIIHAAERPHLGIPETKEDRNTKQYRHLVNHSLIFLSVGTAVSIAALAAYRVYLAKKHTTS